jgi:hypothetical protein
LALFEHDIALPTVYRSKTLVSMIFTESSGSGPMMFFAASDAAVNSAPEPASVALLATGAGMRALCRRRRASR